MSTQPTLLVTGASGHLGQRVIELLLDSEAGTIIAATRSPEKIAHFAERGVIVRHADFNDPTSLATAFDGADRLLLISTDVVGQRAEQHSRAIAAAQQAGVKHVIYTSLAKTSADSPIILAAEHLGTEQALEASTLGYTILRNNVYAEMLIGSLPRAIQSGTLVNASENGKVAYITREDCARAAAAALASTFEGRRVLEISGPEAVSQTDLAQIASDLSGKQIGYVSVPLEDVIKGMESVGLPRFLAETFASFDTGTAQGVLAEVTDAFEDLTGHKPTTVREFLTAHRAAILEPAAA